MKLFAAFASVAICCMDNPANAQSAAFFEPESWHQAVKEYNASSRIEFKSDMSKQIIDALRAYEANN